MMIECMSLDLLYMYMLYDGLDLLLSVSCPAVSSVSSAREGHTFLKTEYQCNSTEKVHNIDFDRYLFANLAGVVVGPETRIVCYFGKATGSIQVQATLIWWNSKENTGPASA